MEPSLIPFFSLSMGIREVVTAASDRLPGHRETTCPCIPSPPPSLPPCPLQPNVHRYLLNLLLRPWLFIIHRPIHRGYPPISVIA